MTKKESLQLFEEKKVRTVWDDKEEKWYFSIVDVCGVLTDSKDANAYWRKLKQRLKKEGNETVTNCHGLKLRASDGKLRMTDVADTEHSSALSSRFLHRRQSLSRYGWHRWQALVWNRCRILKRA